MTFDRAAFHEYPADWFDQAEWKACDPWWMIVNGQKVGCCAFEPRIGARVGRRATLYVTTTAILPSHRGRGLGDLLKTWQIAVARMEGFTRVVSHTRRSNRAMIRLNRKHGFKVVRVEPDYYRDPDESAVMMELVL